MAPRKRETGEPGAGERKHFFDDPGRVRLLIVILFVACASVFALDLVGLRHHEREWEGLPGFYAVYGFLAYTTIVYTAKALRKGVMRDEDYYDR